MSHEGTQIAAEQTASRKARRTSDAPTRLGSIVRVNQAGSPSKKCACRSTSRPWRSAKRAITRGDGWRMRCRPEQRESRGCHRRRSGHTPYRHRPAGPAGQPGKFRASTRGIRHIKCQHGAANSHIGRALQLGPSHRQSAVASHCSADGTPGAPRCGLGGGRHQFYCRHATAARSKRSRRTRVGDPGHIQSVRLGAVAQTSGERCRSGCPR